MHIVYGESQAPHEILNWTLNNAEKEEDDDEWKKKTYTKPKIVAAMRNEHEHKLRIENCWWCVK